MNEAIKSKTWSEQNHWYSPYVAFSDWFDTNGISHLSILPLHFDKNKKDWTIHKYEIAEECRFRKENGHFTSYREAYKYAEQNWTFKGEPIVWQELENAWYQAEQRNSIQDKSK